VVCGNIVVVGSKFEEEVLEVVVGWLWGVGYKIYK